MVNWTGVYTGYKTIQSEDDGACDRVDEATSDTVCARYPPPADAALAR
jgi:hypothetical protein